MISGYSFLQVQKEREKEVSDDEDEDEDKKEGDAEEKKENGEAEEDGEKEKAKIEDLDEEAEKEGWLDNHDLYNGELYCSKHSDIFTQFIKFPTQVMRKRKRRLRRNTLMKKN